MRERPLPSSRIQRYFRGKTRELLAVAGQAIAEHPGLIGSHREQIIRIYLDAILPRRFKVGRGMIYDAGGHRSNEADIVLWDAENYPSLVMQDHSFFFAESVNAVLEVKSNWSTAELEDIKGKCNRISNLLPLRDLSVANEIASLRLDVASLRSGQEHEGALITRPHIATGALFLTGGNEFACDMLSDEDIEGADDNWPDLLLFLSVGRLVVKEYERTGPLTGTGFLQFLTLGEEALMLFTSLLLDLLASRVTRVEAPFYMSQYIDSTFPDLEPDCIVQFPVLRPVPGRHVFWK